MRSSAAQYNPATLSVTGVATLYESFHEHAHASQHARRTLVWRAREAFVRHPLLKWTGLGMLAMCACEVEAVAMARADMVACGIWDAEDRAEAVRGLRSYVWKMISEF